MSFGWLARSIRFQLFAKWEIKMLPNLAIKTSEGHKGWLLTMGKKHENSQWPNAKLSSILKKPSSTALAESRGSGANRLSSAFSEVQMRL